MDNIAALDLAALTLRTAGFTVSPTSSAARFGVAVVFAEERTFRGTACSAAAAAVVNLETGEVTLATEGAAIDDAADRLLRRRR